jgi:CubicO group peptidase (beta-lactamase class C family)
LQAVDALLQNFMDGKPIPGGTIAITHDDKVIYERGIGYSNEARTIPMQETALMRLASVSKPITASAIQQLAKDGQLSLDDKVFNIDGNGGILNITPYNGTLGDSRLRDITLQHLLEHKGGWNREIAGDFAFEDVQIATTMGVPSPPGIDNSARYIVSQPLQFTPGSAENYSNIGYMFLGMVVEAASGQTYEDYVDNHVLAPAGIPVWEVDPGRTFAVDQNPREPVYSDPATFPNVFDPVGPLVPVPYGGWDHEKALAFGGLIASSKAIALLAQNRIASGPEIGKLRSESATNQQNIGGHLGVLPGTLTLLVQESSKDWTYSILFDGLPADWSSSAFSLFNSLNQTLDGVTTWPEALLYAGDFTNDQWLTLEDVTLFKQAITLGDEAAFSFAFPTARYAAGDFDDDGYVSVTDANGFIAALQYSGVPAEYVALVPEMPGDYNRDGNVDAADYTVWRDNFGRSVQLPNETFSLGIVDGDDYAVWRSNFGQSLGVGSGASPAVPESSSLLLALAAAGFGLARLRRPRLDGWCYPA